MRSSLIGFPTGSWRATPRTAASWRGFRRSSCPSFRGMTSGCVPYQLSGAICLLTPAVQRVHQSLTGRSLRISACRSCSTSGRLTVRTSSTVLRSWLWMSGTWSSPTTPIWPRRFSTRRASACQPYESMGCTQTPPGCRSGATRFLSPGPAQAAAGRSVCCVASPTQTRPSPCASCSSQTCLTPTRRERSIIRHSPTRTCRNIGLL
mmetsp:Transcript_21601/g.68438  ORF Transcript_21601/g.68438 Transcript_21601/m.68438 type:complete len:206 (-) Transcript_21601:421-1038(-)